MNRLSTELYGKVVILSPHAYKGDEKARRYLCLDGFGCKGNTWEEDGHGTMIVGRFVSDGEHCSVHGGDVLRLDADQSLPPDLEAHRQEALAAEAAWAERQAKRAEALGRLL